MEGDWRWCPEERERERKGEGQGRTQCPKGVFRNRGKMEENRYSLVAGKSRVERAKRGRTRGGGGCRNSTAWKRESRAHPYRGARIHAYTHTNRTTLRLGLGKTIPGKTPKIRRYETTWEIPLLPFPTRLAADPFILRDLEIFIFKDQLGRWLWDPWLSNLCEYGKM